MTRSIKILGKHDCPGCADLRKDLDDKHVPYSFIDVDKYPEMKKYTRAYVIDGDKEGYANVYPTVLKCKGNSCERISRNKL